VEDSWERTGFEVLVSINGAVHLSDVPQLLSYEMDRRGVRRGRPRTTALDRKGPYVGGKVRATSKTRGEKRSV